MGVVCGPGACRLLKSVQQKNGRKKKRKIVKAKVWSSDSSAISQSKVLSAHCMYAILSFISNVSSNLSFTFPLFFFPLWALISTYRLNSPPRELASPFDWPIVTRSLALPMLPILLAYILWRCTVMAPAVNLMSLLRKRQQKGST